ncbi:MAG: ATP-binding protein [Clostridia bacterium]|nr:ATP-binding protein [Clostridia bacterium]
MFVTFKVSNYRSFRDETVLSMIASGLKEYRGSLIPYGAKKVLPAVAIYGKNGGGKSNLIRAFWLGVQFVRNAQRTQHEKASIPVQPFSLNDFSQKEPTVFEYTYMQDGIKYVYGFSATKTKIVTEYLYHSPKGQKATIFERKGQKFSFPVDTEKKKKELISEAVASNQLYFAVSCTMNYQPCIVAMKWFRESIVFSRDYTDIPNQILEYAEDLGMLKAIVSAAQKADLGIQDMKFEISNKELSEHEELPDNLSDDFKAALQNLRKALSSTPNEAEAKLRVSELKAISLHYGVSKTGDTKHYPLELADESDGTKHLMELAPAIEKTLSSGGILIVDELEKGIHPLLVEYIVARYQSKNSNKTGAQIIFTTHNTELLNMEVLRRDQVYLVDKDKGTGASELYSITEYSPHPDENIRKGYLVGKYGATPNLETEEV